MTCRARRARARPVVAPKGIAIRADLPRTRSGKISAACRAPARSACRKATSRRWRTRHQRRDRMGIFGIMSRLSQDGGDPAVRAAFEKTMSGNPDAANGAPYTPIEMFVMELFRTISPNGGSISSIMDTRQAGSSDNYGDSVSPFVRFGLPYERSGYIISPHTSTSFDPRHWTNPQQFDPDRYRNVPTSAQVDEAKSKQIGFAKCPFDLTTMKVNDGRNAAMANSAFGTVFGVVDGEPLPVCDYAGFAPFGFGYRRCPGEQLTIQVFEDFLRKVWRDKITFRSLNLPNPRQVPIGPNAVIDDNITFARSS